MMNSRQYAVTFTYYAAVRAASGSTHSETFTAASIADARTQAITRHGPEFEQVVARSSYLLDGLRQDGQDFDRPLTKDVAVDILPPFAGG
ncbi:MoaD/ThiS family protein [Timonella sp. A28]|uniref:MoaD/ThiS family protein n=1 Tax=Timonella sp. A28 TaxID=3442640 RepID=UPI003EBBDDD6